MPSIERLRTALAVRGSSNRHEAVPTSHIANMRTLISRIPNFPNNEHIPQEGESHAGTYDAWFVAKAAWCRDA